MSLRADLERLGAFLAAVNDGRDQAFALELVCDGAPDMGARADGEFDLFCHK